MIIFLAIIGCVLTLLFFLKGEGDHYGKCNSYSQEKKSLKITDKNFIL
jgi:hypothetical protein